MKNNSITSDFKKNWIFLSILIIGTIPSILHGYSIYLLVLLFPIILNHIRIRNPQPLFLAIIFGLTYTFPLFLHNAPPPISNLLFYVSYPALFYLIPVYISQHFKNPNSLFLVLIIVVTCIASWSITMNVEDTVISGQLVNLTRSLDDNIKDFEGVVSATNHNMMLALAIGGIGMIFVPTKTEVEAKEKKFLIVLSLAALFSALHLLNRTALVLAFVAIMVALFSRGLSIKYLIKFCAIGALVILVCSILFDKFEWITEIISGFAGREESSSHGLATAGGRNVRWVAAILQIPSYPLGADALFLNGKNTYAHNTWLDCGVQSGWIAFLTLILVTALFIRGAIKVFKRKQIPVFQRTYLLILVLLLILQLMVEPVMEGVYLLFLMMFFLWSVFNVLLFKQKKHIFK